jgi:hypothetical protein
LEINATWVPNIFEVMQPFHLLSNRIDGVVEFQTLPSKNPPQIQRHDALSSTRSKKFE